MRRALVCAVAALVLVSGCASYVAPGGRAELQAFAPPSVQEGFAVKPVAPFPAAIAAVHVQAPSYSNYYLQRNGGVVGGIRYSVVMVRDAEQQSQFDKIASLPQVAGLASINRLLLPPNFQGEKELRDAAARLQADMLLLYTFDTSFFDTTLAKPLTLITLGFAPTRRVYVTTTASALLIDTRTGYVYSAYEVTAKTDLTSSFWGSAESIDEGRRVTERDSFEKLVDEFAASWPKLVERNSKHG